MAVLNVKVVVGPVDVGGDDRSELTAVLVGITTIQHIDHSFGIGVSFVGGVWRTVVDHCFVDRVCRFIGKDASGQTGDAFLYVERVLSRKNNARGGAMINNTLEQHIGTTHWNNTLEQHIGTNTLEPTHWNQQTNKRIE